MIAEVGESFLSTDKLDRHSEKPDGGMKEKRDLKMTLVTSPLAKKEN